MKNVLSEIVTKSDNTLPELNEDDIISIVSLTARIAANLKKIKDTYHNPQQYTKNIQ